MINQRLLPNFKCATFTQRLIGLGIGLTLLFTALSPEASEPLTVLPRALFWSLHIGLGLASAAFAAHLLSRHVVSIRDWRLVVYSGLGGLLMFAPFAYGLEQLFPPAADVADTDWADQFARTSLLAAIIVEAFELAPAFLASWFFINAAPLAASSHDSGDITSELLVARNRSHIPGDVKYSDAHELPTVDNNYVTQPSARSHEIDDVSDSFLLRLPPIVGRDLVAVSSDLHYLQVVTREGKATVLGSLQEVEDTFGDAGLRVHRSHWVSIDAVVSLRKVGTGWQLELIGGHRVPVSRRKKSIVLERLGGDFKRLPQPV